MSILIRHHVKAASDSHFPVAPLLESSWRWSTCLREIEFLEDSVSQEAKASVKGWDEHRGEEALCLLIEILCGLHSPVFGETEILGQFKSYVEKMSPDHPLHHPPELLPFLLRTVKEIRHRHLSAGGSLSYGQILRKWTKTESRLVLWGYGDLGREVWPWLKEKVIQVVVQKDRPRDADIPFSTTPLWDEPVHIIAAPVSDEVLQKLSTKARFIADLREQAWSRPPQIWGLQDLFRELESLRQDRQEIRPRCQKEIRQLVHQFESRHQIRPFGWEDLCC